MTKQEELRNRAKKDFKELKKIVNENQGLTLKELYDKLGGHNYNANFNMFDVNFKNICATIYCINNKIFLDDSVEIWDNEECYYIQYIRYEVE